MIYLSNGLMLILAQAFAARFAGGFIRIFTGAPPATPSAAETGTLLGIVSVNGTGTGLTLASTAAYVYNPPTAQWAFTGLAAGTAGYFRLVAPGDSGLADFTEIRIDGTIDVTGSGADMEWATPAVVSGAIYTIDTFVYVVHPVPRT